MNALSGGGTKFSISSHSINWAADKNNQDLARWLQEGIIDGEYNFQLYKNGTLYESFIKEYKDNMDSVEEALSNKKTGVIPSSLDSVMEALNNKTRVIPSLSVSLGYTAGVDEKGERVLLSKADINRQIKYLRNEDEKFLKYDEKYQNKFPLESENILGFDYGNLVTQVPPDTTPKQA